MLPELTTVTKRRPNPEFDTPEDVRRICGEASLRLSEKAVETALAAVVIEQFLKRIPDGSLGLSSRLRARLVVRSLKICSRLLGDASGQAAGTYYAMVKYFARQMEEGE
jgi:hypothetical protein